MEISLSSIFTLALLDEPILYEELLGRVPIQHLESDWLLRSFVDEVRTSSLYLIAKRLLDIVASVVGLFLLAIMSW